MSAVRPAVHPHVEDGTSREDLAIYLTGWRRYRALAAREDRVRYDVRARPLLARLEEHLAALRLYAAMAPAEFLADDRNAAAAQLRLFMAMAAAIDATKWLAGRAGVRGRPRSFADAFELLVRAGALPAARRRVYAGLARFRNWMAHEAVVLPPAKVQRLIRFYLPVLEEFADLLRTK